MVAFLDTIDRYVYLKMTVVFGNHINPFMPNGLFYLNYLDSPFQIERVSG